MPDGTSTHATPCESIEITGVVLEAFEVSHPAVILSLTTLDGQVHEYLFAGSEPQMEAFVKNVTRCTNTAVAEAAAERRARAKNRA